MKDDASLSGYEAVFVSAGTRARALVDPLSRDQFNWKPTRERWSIGECLDHLNRVASGYVPAMESVIAAAPREGDGPCRYGWLARKFIASVSPGSRKVRTFGPMKPEPTDSSFSSLDKGKTIADFEHWIERYVTIVRDARDVDAVSVKMRSPFFRLLRLPVGAFIKAMGQHNLRHLDQAEALTSESAFPDG